MHIIRTSLLTLSMYLFYLTLNILVLSSLLSLFELWLVIEVATFIFIVCSLLSLSDYSFTIQGLVSYFLVQAGLSMALLFLLLIYSASWDASIYLVGFILISKLGMIPFGMWVYPVLTQLNSFALLNAMAWQKLPPLLIFSLVIPASALSLSILVFNVLLSGALALSSLQLVPLLVFSSIANNSWFLLALYNQGLASFLLLFFIYLLGVSIALLPSSQSGSYLGVLSLSGLPPFPLFFAKLFILIGVSSWAAGWYTSSVMFFFLLSSVMLSSAYIRFFSTAIVLSFW